MSDTMSWYQIGLVLGGMAAGTAAGAVFLSKHFPKKSSKKDDTGEHGPSVRRDEFTVAMSEIRVRIDESLAEAREARAAANATQVGLTTIGQMIESSMRSLGDRLEGALRDVKDRVDDHAEEITDHHGRLRSVETELELRRRGDNVRSA